MTNPNSNRPILSLRPKVVIPPPVVEVMSVTEPPAPAKAKKVTNASTIRKLKKLFPLAFFGFKEDKFPLACGIHKQIFDAETGIGRKRIRDAIRSYTGSISYHNGIISSENRINLDGSIASAVTGDDKAYAVDRIAVIEKVKLERKIVK